MNELTVLGTTLEGPKGLDRTTPNPNPKRVLHTLRPQPDYSNSPESYSIGVDWTCLPGQS